MRWSQQRLARESERSSRCRSRVETGHADRVTLNRTWPSIAARPWRCGHGSRPVARAKASIDCSTRTRRPDGTSPQAPSRAGWDRDRGLVQRPRRARDDRHPGIPSTTGSSWSSRSSRSFRTSRRCSATLDRRSASPRRSLEHADGGSATCRRSWCCQTTGQRADGSNDTRDLRRGAACANRVEVRRWLEAPVGRLAGDPVPVRCHSREHSSPVGSANRRS